jgi:hypothetical protein
LETLKYQTAPIFGRFGENVEFPGKQVQFGTCFAIWLRSSGIVAHLGTWGTGNMPLVCSSDEQVAADLLHRVCLSGFVGLQLRVEEIERAGVMMPGQFGPISRVFLPSI